MAAWNKTTQTLKYIHFPNDTGESLVVISEVRLFRKAANNTIDVFYNNLADPNILSFDNAAERDSVYEQIRQYIFGGTDGKKPN